VPASLTPGASRRLIAAFVLLLVLPAGTVVWLGLHLVVRDREREADARRGAQADRANHIAAVLTARLDAAESALTARADPDDAAVLLLLRANGIETRPPGRLAWPAGPTTPQAGSGASPVPADPASINP
jgi:hypothetical protein